MIKIASYTKRFSVFFLISEILEPQKIVIECNNQNKDKRGEVVRARIEQFRGLGVGVNPDLNQPVLVVHIEPLHVDMVVGILHKP